jgi:SMC interacting uncharacterized protein involved in chromosome segregation
MTPVKLQESELASLKTIQDQLNTKLWEFGQLYIERLVLDEKLKLLSESESKLRSEYSTIQENEQKWIDSISSKYGNGSLSLKDGTFTPS